MAPNNASVEDHNLVLLIYILYPILNIPALSFDEQVTNVCRLRDMITSERCVKFVRRRRMTLLEEPSPAASLALRLGYCKLFFNAAFVA